MTAAALKLLGDLLERATGQRIAPVRAWRMESALQPVLRAWSIPDIDALAAALGGTWDSALARACVEAMLNNETSFFRDQAAFALLTGPALTELRHLRRTTRRMRIWSAACSTGQEPLSVAMTLLDEPERWAGWSIEIVATDVSRAAVQKARSCRYSQFEIQRGLPVTHMLRHFERQGDDWIARPPLQKMVKYREHNLLDDVSHLGRFDVSCAATC